MKKNKKEIYSFDPNPTPKNFFSIDREYEAIYNKIKHTPRTIDELVALRFKRDTIIYYIHVGLFKPDKSNRIYPTMAGRAHLKQRSIEKRRNIATAIISIFLSVIASLLVNLFT